MQPRRAFLRTMAGATLGAAAVLATAASPAAAQSLAPNRRQQVSACGRIVTNPEAGGGCITLALRRRMAEGGSPVSGEVTCQTCGSLVDPSLLENDTDEGYGPGIHAVAPVSRDIPVPPAD